MKTYALAIVVISCFFLQGKIYAFYKTPPVSIPGSSVLHVYRGAKFYSNIWPLFVSYYTNEWTVGGIHPQDAIKRMPQNARLFLQKNKLCTDRYAKPNYYFYVFSDKFAPFAAPQYKKMLDDEFSLAECGKDWCIYKMESDNARRSK
jgi:hypothetical protein